MPSSPDTSRTKRIIALILGLVFMGALVYFMAQPRPVPDAKQASFPAPLSQA
ncbi:hypothetical protein [Litorimonas sp. WD9-15]|uniref:hypothetical protein n=1 Tax=Litorimonas sp. WD9-15 TaxID=3418716 RepID=UPI003D01E612